MEQQTIERPNASRPRWENLETLVRAQIQEYLQRLLEEEVTARLGRATSARRAPLEAPAGSRNGDGKPRRVALMGELSLASTISHSAESGITVRSAPGPQSENVLPNCGNVVTVPAFAPRRRRNRRCSRSSAKYGSGGAPWKR